MTNADRIRKAREAKGLTQEELGKICGTTKQTIQKYEAGTVTNIPLDRVEQMAAALSVPPASLVGWDNSIEREPIVTEINEIIENMGREELEKIQSYIRFIKSGG